MHNLPSTLVKEDAQTVDVYFPFTSGHSWGTNWGCTFTSDTCQRGGVNCGCMLNFRLQVQGKAQTVDVHLPLNPGKRWEINCRSTLAFDSGKGGCASCGCTYLPLQVTQVKEDAQTVDIYLPFTTGSGKAQSMDVHLPLTQAKEEGQTVGVHLLLTSGSRGGTNCGHTLIFDFWLKRRH